MRSLILLVLLVGCYPTQGLVIEKQHQPTKVVEKSSVIVQDGSAMGTYYEAKRYILDQEDFVLILEDGTRVYTCECIWNELDSGKVWRRTRYCRFKDKNNLRLGREK